MLDTIIFLSPKETHPFINLACQLINDSFPSPPVHIITILFLFINSYWNMNKYRGLCYTLNYTQSLSFRTVQHIKLI